MKVQLHKLRRHYQVISKNEIKDCQQIRHFSVYPNPFRDAINVRIGKKLVVLLHGWPEFWYSWHHQIIELSKKFTVVAVDMRGFNESEKPKGKENYQAHIVGNDIAELIPKLGFKKAHIVGHDWGGAIAWGFAMNHSQLVRSVGGFKIASSKRFLLSF
ncbi:MAG: alpha/beta fold hydrolase [Bacteroidetes bacterium]|nr:alpha/beta fold hydrolase [Bacteroidota bacterium]